MPTHLLGETYMGHVGIFKDWMGQDVIRTITEHRLDLVRRLEVGRGCHRPVLLPVDHMPRVYGLPAAVLRNMTAKYAAQT